MKHFVTPVGFEVKLFVAEPQLEGKPIFMTWDERGRLWVCETYDYPNELQPRRRRPRPHPHLRRHRRRRPGRQIHGLCREAEHSDDDRLLSRRGDRAERHRDDLSQGHQRRRPGRPQENARHRLEHARHARRSQQFPLRPRQLVLGHAGLQRFAARADQRQAGPALPPGLLPLQSRRRKRKRRRHRARIPPLDEQQHLGPRHQRGRHHFRLDGQRQPQRAHADPQPLLRSRPRLEQQRPDRHRREQPLLSRSPKTCGRSIGTAASPRPRATPSTRPATTRANTGTAPPSSPSRPAT